MRMASLAPLLLALVLVPAAAWAQSTTQALENRLLRLEREIQTLSRAVYRGETPATAPRPAPGEPVPETDLGVGTLPDMELRVSRLVSDIRALRGTVEEQGYKIQNLERTIERLVADLDFRFSQLALNAGAAPLGPAASAAPGNQQQPSTSPADPAATPPPGTAADTGAQPGRPGGTLGTIPAPGSAPPTQATAPQPAAPATAAGSPETLYEQAFARLSQADYETAEALFSQFLSQYPSHRLAANAHYWRAETYYVRNRMEDAAIAFAEGVQSFPDSTKAADSLLKLAMSLGQLGREEDACASLAELNRRFPDAAPNIRQLAQREAQTYRCS